MAVQPCVAISGTTASSAEVAATAGSPPAPLTTFFSNLGRKYPNGVYYCCNGIAVSGPSNNESALEQWYAVAYTPSVSFTLERIQMAVGYFSGTNNIIAAVFSDNGAGLPDVQLGAWHMANMPNNGTCCLIETAATGGVSLVNGVKYWIVLKTINTDKDTLVFWERNTTDQVNGLDAVYYCSQDHQGSCSSSNDHWVSFGSLRPAPAFALLGN